MLSAPNPGNKRCLREKVGQHNNTGPESGDQCQNDPAVAPKPMHALNFTPRFTCGQWEKFSVTVEATASPARTVPPADKRPARLPLQEKSVVIFPVPLTFSARPK